MDKPASESTLNTTPLHDRHLALGARMVDFGGWHLPVQYTGILEEHRAVRERAGLFDVSHMGEIEVAGVQARAFLDYLLTADVSRLSAQRALYSPMCTEDGGTVDDLIVYQQTDDDYLLVVNAANTEKDVAWISGQAQRFADGTVRVRNCSAEFAQLALQGPNAAAQLAALPGFEPATALRFFQFLWLDDESGHRILVSRTGYTGEDGFEIYCPPALAGPLFDRLIAGGAVPCGLGARDSLRFEAALPLYGHELTPDITPREAGLDRFIALDKEPYRGREAYNDEAFASREAFEQEAFIGRVALAAPPARRLVGLAVEGRAIPRADYPVLYQGAVVGHVTSGMFAPTLGRGCAMALVEAACADGSLAGSGAGEPAGPEGGFAIMVRGRPEAARLTGLPFYRRPR